MKKLVNHLCPPSDKNSKSLGGLKMQLDRALDYESRGQGFESSKVRHRWMTTNTKFKKWLKDRLVIIRFVYNGKKYFQRWAKMTRKAKQTKKPMLERM